MDGWIKIHRSLADWEWITNPIMVSVWIHFLIDANFENRRFQGTVIKRGQLPLGREQYAERCGISEQQLRSCINRLKSTNEITTQSTSHGTIVTICQYELYQSGFDESTNESTNNLTNNQPAINQQSTTPKELKNIRTKEVCVFTPPKVEEVMTYCKERKNNVDPNKFIDFYTSKGWMVGKNKMKDWQAAVRNWEKNDIKPPQQPLCRME